MQGPTLIMRSIVALLAILAFAPPVLAGSELNVDAQGVALKGYDPVAYFEQGEAVPGSEEHTAEVDGATYRFASAEHRDAFAANPEKYQPQFGGYCAMAASMGKKFDVEPDAFRVVDGKLYLNLNTKVQGKWLEDVPGNIDKANEMWPEIKGKSPEEL